ncbi:MAG: flagellin [Pseudomonadota bacterium]
MTFQGIGDLAVSFQVRRDNARLQDTFRRLSNELSSGTRADLGRAVSGDFGALSGIERSIRAIDAYRISASETGLMVDAAQITLELVRGKANDVAPALLLSNEDFDPGFVNAGAAAAARAFEDTVSALNARIGDRSVFAGIDTDNPALAGPETMLTELETLIAAETTAAGVETVVAAWFDIGGGYEAIGYLGNVDLIEDIPISEGEKASLGVNALDPGIREVLTGLALGALLDRGALTGNNEERAILANSGGDRLVRSEYTLTQTQTTIGITQERIDSAKTRNETESQALQVARAAIIEVDPFETAAQLQAVEVQLETLYAITARLNRLNLADYL